jgi:hypothetical protein
VTFYLNGDEVFPTLMIQGEKYIENEGLYPMAYNFDYDLCSVEYSMLPQNL